MSDVIPKIPVKYNFEILRGTDYTFQFLIRDCEENRVSLRSYNIKVQLRKGFSTNIIDEFTTKNLKIVNSSNADDDIYDLVTIKFNHKDTAEYPLGVLLYDVRIESGNHTYTKIIEGQINCLANITQ